MEEKKSRITYKDAGVDIDAGNQLVNNISEAVRRTNRPGVVSGLGGFGGLFELPSGFKKPILVSGTDGVGTKLRLAIDYNMHAQIGIDLVGMCVNDVVVCGAEPLFFLDYYATGKLKLKTAEQVVNSIAEGCQMAGCALIGGETAEMPGMYQDADYDLAGFCVGIVEKSKMIDGNSVQAGDILIGMASSGPHSNGYSLIRKILQTSNTDPTNVILAGMRIIDLLMAPTRIYVRTVLKLCDVMQVNALAHITGGGFQENISRVLPQNCKAVIDHNSWQRPKIFDWLQRNGNIDNYEMYRTFNCGIGMVVCVPPNLSADALNLLSSEGEQAAIIGEVVTRDDNSEPIEIL